MTSPIDDERRTRSPGLAKNFYDLPQSTSSAIRLRWRRWWRRSTAASASRWKPRLWSFPAGAPAGFGSVWRRVSMPGREQEYQNMMASGAVGSTPDR